MKTRALLAIALSADVVWAQAARPTPPPSRRDDVREVLHGVEIIDPYRWLEDDKSPETRAWIDAQNAHTHAVLDGSATRETIRRRLAALSRYDVQAAPLRRGNRYFVSRRRATDDLFIHYVREGAEGADTVLLDPHALSPDHTVDVSLDDVSQDGRVLVYGLRRGGEDETELHVRDVARRTDLPDVLPRGLYRGVSLLPDGGGFYYSAQSRQTGIRVRYHAMGTPPEKDVEVFGAGYGPSQWIGADVSENGRHLLLTVQHGWARNEVFVKDLPGNGPVRTIVKDVAAHFRPQFAGDRLILQTDWKAPRWRIVEVDLNNPSPERWREIVPEGPDTIQGFVLAGGTLVVHALHDVASQVRLYALDGARLGELPMPGPGSAGAFQARWSDDELFFDFNAYTTPRTTYRAEVRSKKVAPWWRPEVPFDSASYETRQVWYASKDGTRVPMFVTHRKGLALDGRRPTLLTGYGGFNVSILPTFSATAAWWIEQGGVYAVPNLRGGAEFGEAWHRAGMLDRKQNVFDDFIAAAQWLVANRYTEPGRLAIRGASNGGLLVGAAFTQRPELFRAVLCDFPDLDMLGYYRFPNNNPPALLEYGSAAIPEQFQFLRAYSPYQQVKAGTAYPAVFFTTGDADTRVPPLQARKMTARVQAATSSGRPVLLLYDTKAGHAGGRPVGKVVEDLSMQLAFLAGELGMEVAPAPGVSDGPYAPQPILPGGIVVTLYAPGSPDLNGARVREAEVYNMATGVPGRIQSIVNIHNPSIEVHVADPAINTGAAVIVVAGGAHRTLNVGSEGADVVAYLYNYGVNAIILRNRLRNDGYVAEVDAVKDALQAIRLTRARAAEWKIDPRKIGVMGFSAGAELAAATGVIFADFDEKHRGLADPLDQVSARPSFVVLVYPGPTPFARGASPKIPRNVPPSFIVSAGSGDRVHAFWADEYFGAMLKLGVPNLEMHVYGNGVHGGGLKHRDGIPFGTWPDRFIEWFRDLGFLAKPGVETKAERDAAAFASQPPAP